MKMQLLKRLRHVPMAAAMAGTLLLASAAHADVESGKLVLSGFADAAAGEQLLAGNYASVIQKLAPHASDFNVNEVAASTNLCVAYVASGRLDEARNACNEAIKLARLDDIDVPFLERLAHQDPLSIAKANRAVLGKLSGQ
jgi:Flp pilus assembly protein TadD